MSIKKLVFSRGSYGGVVDPITPPEPSGARQSFVCMRTRLGETFDVCSATSAQWVLVAGNIFIAQNIKDWFDFATSDMSGQNFFQVFATSIGTAVRPDGWYLFGDTVTGTNKRFYVKDGWCTEIRIC